MDFKTWTKQFTIIAVILLVMMVIMSSNGHSPSVNANTLSYSEFIRLAQTEKLDRVQIDPTTGVAISSGKDGQRYRTVLMPNDVGLTNDLLKGKVLIDVQEKAEPSVLVKVLENFGPTLLLIVFLVWMTKQSQPNGRAGNPFGYAKSKAKAIDSKDNPTRLADVAGCDEAKQEVGEIIDFLRNPSRYQKLGGRPPRGILMAGPPGTGKTLLAKAIAGEAGVPFYTTSGSDFVEMFVGVGAARVRDMFEQAKKHAPSLIFIDEIDAVGRRRSGGMGGGNDEREQTLNALLVEMDGFETNSGVIVIAATNRTDVLDPALRRPGRFDREVHVGLADIKGREQILKVHARKVPMDKNVNLARIARGTPGFSGADLANVVNEAALFAARRSKSFVDTKDFEDAKDKIMMGAERKSAVMPAKELKTTAWHEAGHAVVAYFLPNADPLHKVTIIPRGQALGVTMQLPAEDRYGYGKKDLMTSLAVLLGGRIAEELFLDDITTGASNDLERVTSMAHAMVARYGMSDLGVLSYTERQGSGFKGDSSGGSTPFSELTQQKVDEEVNRIVKEQYERVTQLLKDHKAEMTLLAEALLKRETLDAEEIDELFGMRREHGIGVRSTKPVTAVEAPVTAPDAGQGAWDGLPAAQVAPPSSGV